MPDLREVTSPRTTLDARSLLERGFTLRVESTPDPETTNTHDKLPLSHLEFFDSLSTFCRTDDVICVHAGLDPDVPSMEEQDTRTLVWGCPSFPERYVASTPVVYGHWGNCERDERARPRPREVNRTYGIDSIESGVLTALRFPSLEVIQSKQYPMPESSWS